MRRQLRPGPAREAPRRSRRGRAGRAGYWSSAAGSASAVRLSRPGATTVACAIAWISVLPRSAIWFAATVRTATAPKAIERRAAMPSPARGTRRVARRHARVSAALAERRYGRSLSIRYATTRNSGHRRLDEPVAQRCVRVGSSGRDRDVALPHRANCDPRLSVRGVSPSGTRLTRTSTRCSFWSSTSGILPFSSSTPSSDVRIPGAISSDVRTTTTR